MQIKFEVKGVMYHITNDERQLILYKNPKSKKDKDGKMKITRDIIGYYPTMKSLCNALLELNIRKSKKKTLKDILEEIRDLKRIISRLLEI